MKPQGEVIEDLVAVFQQNVRRIVVQASRAVRIALGSKLSVVDGVIAKTQSNQRILQHVDALFQREMDRAGYPALVKSYVAQFNGQFQYFNATLDTLGEQIGRKLDIKFGPRDKALFVAQQVTASRLLDGVVSQSAAVAERTAMLSVGGLKLGVLVEAIADKLAVTVPQAVTVADTSLSMFYRTISDRGYRIIERDLPSMELRYKYGGPSDALVRPFCRLRLRETSAGISWTRADIDAMSNGQITNVFLTCGGWNCRHQWLLGLG